MARSNYVRTGFSEHGRPYGSAVSEYYLTTPLRIRHHCIACGDGMEYIESADDDCCDLFGGYTVTSGVTSTSCMHGQLSAEKVWNVVDIKKTIDV